MTHWEYRRKSWKHALVMMTHCCSDQAAGNGVDPAQKRTRPKHAFSGPEQPRDQRLLMSFRRVRQGRTNVFEKKLFGY